MKPRGLLIAGNWKMNHTARETDAYFAELRAHCGRLPAGPFRAGAVRACLIPPYLSLARATEAVKGFPIPIVIGAQNAHWEEKGAFTGEISGRMLQELGVGVCLVGHSERRQLFGETDDTARRRAESLLDQGFTAILCIGETRAEREGGRTSEVLTRQLKGALPAAEQGAAKFLDGRLVLAYEPIWAIGTGLTATPEQAEEAHQAIRKHLWDCFGMEAAGRTPILYGGSVTPENAASLLACANVDGALVGGASLKPDGFLAILAAAATEAETAARK